MLIYLFKIVIFVVMANNNNNSGGSLLTLVSPIQRTSFAAGVSFKEKSGQVYAGNNIEKR
jgi:hypothetical protein